MTALSIERLSVNFGATAAVSDASWSAEAGAITVVMGPNGAGKTTTMRVVTGLTRASAGRVQILGQVPGSVEARQAVGVMLQSGGFYPSITPRRALTHLAGLYAQPRSVDQVLELVGLSGVATPYRRLSGGQQRMLSLGAALIGRPELVILDEPSSGLDPQARLRLWELLSQFKEAGITVVMTTHLPEEAERIADHVVIYRRGSVVLAGPPATLVHADDALSFSARPGLDLRELSQALPAECRAVEVSPGRYVIDRVREPQVIATVTAWCAQQDVMPQGLSVGNRTLEDVYLEATDES